MAKKYNYDKLMGLYPTVLGDMVNSDGQKVLFLEHPLRGDEAPVIVQFPEYRLAFDSEFWDTDDMEEVGGCYEPSVLDGKLYHGDILAD